MICDNINMNKSKMILNVNKTNIYTFKFEGYFLKIPKKNLKIFYSFSSSSSSSEKKTISFL